MASSQFFRILFTKPKYVGTATVGKIQRCLYSSSARPVNLHKHFLHLSAAQHALSLSQEAARPNEL